MQRRAVAVVVGRDLLEVGDRGDQLGGDAGLLGPGLEQHLQELNHSAGALGRRLGPGLLHMRRVGLGAGQGFLDRRQQLRGEAGAREALRGRAQARQSVHVGRRLGGDLVDRLVLDDPPARLVAGLGGALAPGGHGLEHGDVFRSMPPRLQPPPGVLRRHVIVGRIDEARHFLFDPGEAPFPLQPLAQHRVELRQVDDIAGGVVELGLRQRPPAPVREPTALVDVDAEELPHEGVIGDLLAEAGGHGRDLGVEQRMGNDAQVIEDFHVLAAGMEDLLDLRVGHQIEERLEVQPLGHGVDHRGDIGARGLDQAEPGPIGGLSHELGVDGDEGPLGELGAEPFQFAVGSDRGHRLAIARRTGESATHNRTRAPTLTCVPGAISRGP